MRVYWLIEGIEKSLYTAKGVRIIKDKQTGKEYAPNKMEFFKKNEAPKDLAEDTDKYDFYPMHSESRIERAGLFRKRKVITIPDQRVKNAAMDDKLSIPLPTNATIKFLSVAYYT